MRIVSVCYREEEKTHNREIAVQLVRDCYREKNAISERLLSGEDASACSKKKIIIFFLPERPNNSLLDMTARNDKFK